MEYIELDYARDSEIDIEALDVEWASLPALEERYVDQCGRMKRAVIRATEEMKLAHEKVKNTRSKLLRECHDHPNRCIGKDKATGPEAEAYYRTHPDYVIAKKKFINAEIRVMEAEEEHTSAENMLSLIHFTKTKALEHLVNLHNSAYFAGPDAPRDLMSEMNSRSRKHEKNRQASRRFGANLRVKRNE